MNDEQNIYHDWQGCMSADTMDAMPMHRGPLIIKGSSDLLQYYGFQILLITPSH